MHEARNGPLNSGGQGEEKHLNERVVIDKYGKFAGSLTFLIGIAIPKQSSCIVRQGDSSNLERYQCIFCLYQCH